MKKIIVGIPCYNEESSIKKVIEDFKRELPEARIFVVDNNSTDRTAEIARNAGAEVFSEKKQGKGFAVQKLFKVFNGDILVLVDGDDTYPAESVKKLLEPVVSEEVEMVVGNRIHNKNMKNFSRSHWFGNKFFIKFLNVLFGKDIKIKDVFSGYRVFSRDFISAVILLSKGFEIESELSIQAIENKLKIKEIDVFYRLRKAGSNSKIKTFRDGVTILYVIISLFRDYKPLVFFSSMSFIFLTFSFLLGWYGIKDYFATGMVYHFPSLFVSGFFAIASFVSFIAGLILSSIKRRYDEIISILKK
jgi:glycosyltransferase involved in cell wall biosynthesis